MNRTEIEVDNKLLLSIREVAQLLGVSQRAIWGWAHDGKFPAPLELGRLRRWRRQDIETWLAEQSDTANGGTK